MLPQMDRSSGFREGIEDSIRRCEELLALRPLAFVPSATSCSSSRRRYGGKETTADDNVHSNESVNVDAQADSPPEKVWKRNMDLLSSCADTVSRTEEKVETKSESGADGNRTEESTSSEWWQSVSGQRSHSAPESASKGSTHSFEKRGSACGRKYEWESECSVTSSDWTLDRISHGKITPNQNSGSQVEDSSKCPQKSIPTNGARKAEADGRGDAVLPAEACTDQISQNISMRESATSTKGRGGVRETVSLEFSDPGEQTEGGLSNNTSSSKEECKSGMDFGNQLFTDDGSSAYAEHPRSSDSKRFKCGNSGPPVQSCETYVRQESSTELSEVCAVEDLAVAVDASWEGIMNTSDRPTSAGSEQKTDTSFSASSGHDMEQKHVQSPHQQNYREERRSKSVPRGVFQGNKLEKHRRSKSVSRERLEDRLQTLARPRTEVYKKLADLKSILENKKLQECSFKPLVGRKPDPESPHSAPIFERIMEMQQRLELRKRARKAYEKEELDNCSFWPRINWRSQFFDKVTYQPIQKRFQELQKGLETVHVAERLTTMQPSVHLDCKLEPEKKKNTFAPEINKNTDYIIASSKQFGGCSAGFLERQQQYMQSVEDRKKSKDHGTPCDLTFRPDIGNSVLILKQSQAQGLFQESPLQRCERLAYKDKEQLCHIREKVAEDYYAQFNFQPEIDGFSRILASQNSLHDLHKNEKGRKAKEALQQAAENEFQQKCPFRPEEKAKYEQESRTLRELQELKECTFKPCVNPSPPKETAPAVIKGLERHLELQCIAKQMKREQEELERKVFFSHAYAFPMRQYTIPRPFVLQTAQGRCHRRS